MESFQLTLRSSGEAPPLEYQQCHVAALVPIRILRGKPLIDQVFGMNLQPSYE